MSFAERSLLAVDPVLVASRHVKAYHVTLDAAPVEPSVVAAAMAFLPRLLPAPEPPPDGTPPASFVILHRSAQAAYLNAYSWVWDNVIECRTAAAGIPFLGCPDDDPTVFVELAKPWIGCVWELGPFEYERSAWVRHMLEPAAPDLGAYLADRPSGLVTGGPRVLQVPIAG
jgi:hypothetical protein